MLKIAHRGNLYGPDPERENTPDAISEALALGYDVEIDIWLVDGKLYLGHDEPTYLIDSIQLAKIGSRGWFHCKNLAVLQYFKESKINFNYFWHQNDDYTLTSNGYFWTYPGMETNPYSILVHLGIPDADTLAQSIHGICSDHFLTV